MAATGVVVLSATGFTQMGFTGSLNSSMPMSMSLQEVRSSLSLTSLDTRDVLLGALQLAPLSAGENQSVGGSPV